MPAPYDEPWVLCPVCRITWHPDGYLLCIRCAGATADRMHECPATGSTSYRTGKASAG